MPSEDPWIFLSLERRDTVLPREIISLNPLCPARCIYMRLAGKIMAGNVVFCSFSSVSEGRRARFSAGAGGRRFSAFRPHSGGFLWVRRGLARSVHRSPPRPGAFFGATGAAATLICCAGGPTLRLPTVETSSSRTLPVAAAATIASANNEPASTAMTIAIAIAIAITIAIADAIYQPLSPTLLPSQSPPPPPPPPPPPLPGRLSCLGGHQGGCLYQRRPSKDM